MDSFKKRQKEVQRMEKQREKAARRFARKNEPPAPESDTPVDGEPSAASIDSVPAEPVSEA